MSQLGCKGDVVIRVPSGAQLKSSPMGLASLSGLRWKEVARGHEMGERGPSWPWQARC